MTVHIPHESQRKHRSAHLIRSRRLAHVAAFSTLMKECEIIGPSSTLKINGEVNISLCTLRKKYQTYRREIYLNIPPTQMKSLHDQRGIKSQVFSPAEEEKLAHHIRNVMAAGIELVNKNWIRREALLFYQECH